MATRCQLNFTVENESVLIYRHWDGYPADVIETLKEFFKWNNGRNDLEYMTANYILFEKLTSIHRSNHWAKKTPTEHNRVETIESILNTNNDHNANWLLSYGICQPGDLHGDIQFYYEVKVNKASVTVKVKDSAEGVVISTHRIKL
jgi:hypothetical protein